MLINDEHVGTTKRSRRTNGDRMQKENHGGGGRRGVISISVVNTLFLVASAFNRGYYILHGDTFNRRVSVCDS